VPITDSQSASFGLLAMYAEDMYSAAVGSLNPSADPRIAAAGWTIVGYLTAQDALIPAKGAPRRTLRVDQANRVFFGFVARNKADPTSYIAAVRGTEGIVEWVIDAEFLLIPHPRHAGVQVEQGFWSIYQTLSLADPASGVTTHQNAAEGVAKLVGADKITVTGHSLGSALATYFTEDLAERLGPRTSACLFASPRTGDGAWVNTFNTSVKDCRLFNYILDIVTHVPTLGYATLPNTTLIQPLDSAGWGLPGRVLQSPCYLLLRDDRLPTDDGRSNNPAGRKLQGLHHFPAIEHARDSESAGHHYQRVRRCG
jgi:triacylglycerol lipase